MLPRWPCPLCDITFCLSLCLSFDNGLFLIIYYYSPTSVFWYLFWSNVNSHGSPLDFESLSLSSFRCWICNFCFLILFHFLFSLTSIGLFIDNAGLTVRSGIYSANTMFWVACNYFFPGCHNSWFQGTHRSLSSVDPVSTNCWPMESSHLSMGSMWALLV